MRSLFRSVFLFCAFLVSILTFTAPAAHAQGGDPGGYRPADLASVIVTEVYDSSGNTTDVVPSSGIPTHQQIDDQYGGDGGFYVTTIRVFDPVTNEPVGDPIFVQSGELSGGGEEVRSKLPSAPIIYEQRCAGDEKPTIHGSVALGGAQTAPFFQSGEARGAMGEARLSLNSPDLCAFVSYRHSFYEPLDRLTKWTAGVEVPCSPSTSLFATWERPHGGTEWGWAGIRLALF